MAPMMALPAELIAKLVGAAEGRKWKILDIAAGHGLFGITLAKHNPNAEVVAVDWPKVLEVARANARAAGAAGRYRTLPGSAFDVDYGEGYDLVLLTNFLHHFDIPTCEGLLRKVHAALATGGRAVTFEFVPNEDRVSPPIPAKFSMIMLATTQHGEDRKSTRLNSSHLVISYAVFCLKKKKIEELTSICDQYTSRLQTPLKLEFAPQQDDSTTIQDIALTHHIQNRLHVRRHVSTRYYT